MKKTMKTLLALMAGVMTFSACSKESVQDSDENPQVEGISTFTAYTESDGSTRAYIEDLDVKWQSGDAILMMDGTKNSQYNLATGENTTSATFTVADGSTAVSGQNIYALSPYAGASARLVSIEEAKAQVPGPEYWQEIENLWNNSYKRGKGDSNHMSNFKKQLCQTFSISSEAADIIVAHFNETPIESSPALNGSSITNVTLPTTQTVTGEQVVDPKAVLMVAKADGQDLSFKNVCSYIKVTPTEYLKKIVLSANNGENIAGSFTVNVSDEPSVSNVNGSSSITLMKDNGLLEPGKTYYIAVLPNTLAGGLRIEFYSGYTNFATEKSISTSFTFARKNVYNGGTNPTKGTAVRNDGNGTTTVDWVQLWPNGPRFAVYNVGAANNKPQDFGGYYTWGGSTDKSYSDYYTGNERLTGNNDTATKLWGDNWRMPTNEECRTLTNTEGYGNKCNPTWTTNYNNTGIQGALIYGTGTYYSGNSVFIPAAGRWCTNANDRYIGLRGRYYTSDPSIRGFPHASFMFLNNNSFGVHDGTNNISYERTAYCNPVRAVLNEN